MDELFVPNSKFPKNGRELQKLIGSTKDHTNWAKYCIERFGLTQGKDFTPHQAKSTGGRPLITYWFTEEVAYKIATRIDQTKVKEPEKTIMVKDNIAAKSIMLDEIFVNPDVGIAFLQKVKEQRKQIEQSETKIKELSPKAKYYDEVLKSESTFLTTEIAKELGMTAVALNLFLKNHKFQYNVRGVWVLYESYQHLRWTKTTTFKYIDGAGHLQTRHQTEWTEKGREFIIRYVNEHRMENKSIR